MHLLRLIGSICLILLAIRNNEPLTCLGLDVPTFFWQKKRGTAYSSSASAENDKNDNKIINNVRKNKHQGQAILLSSICALTGKEEYEFGDLARWLDHLAREKVQELAVASATNHHHHHHHHGNITKTENLGRFRYLFQHPYVNMLKQTKVVLLVWLVRIVVVFQWEAHVLKYLPNMLLIEMVHQCFNNASVRPKILRVISTEMDHRINNLLEHYHFGDLTRGTIHNVKLSQQAVIKLTGAQQSDYVFGDISKHILMQALERHEKQNASSRATSDVKNTKRADMTHTLIQKQIDFIDQMQANQSNRRRK
jgi:hypothetical protein